MSELCHDFKVLTSYLYVMIVSRILFTRHEYVLSYLSSYFYFLAGDK
jgi:hypothetical protein